MIAVGRYDTIGPGKAEVAFLVEDRHQGRGIGQLLLEHLAQAGRERGIERFVAEVLPDNQAMIHTFKDAGYQVKSAYDDGVMELEFPHRPHRHRDRGDGAARAPRRVRLHRAVLPAPLGRRHRRQPPPGHHRSGARAQPGARRLHRPGPRRQPERGLGVRHAGLQDRRRHPRRGRRRHRRRAGRRGAGRRARLRGQGRARPRRHLLGLRRDGRGGTAPPAPPRRAVPLLRPAPDRPQRARAHQHRPRGLAQRLALVA